jgi:Transposase and inactivated derivatives
MFKSYTTNDNLLLPPCLGDFIDANDPVRVVDRIIEQLDLSILLKQYSRVGNPAYHPRLLLKMLIYGYLRNTYSSRRIEELGKNDIRFLWLNGMSCPDHNTINRFRSGRLKGVLKEVFASIVKFLVQEGLVSLETTYTDGTKIEANANRYTFVWGKSITTRISKISDQLNELWTYAESVTKQELRDSAPMTYHQVTPEKVEEAVGMIETALEGANIDKKIRQKLNRVKKAWPEQLRKYEQQGVILGERNSYSKTDPDATFMMMKEDHMKNGQLKPGYNLQISTYDQYILNYSLHQTTADTITYASHMDEFKQLYGQYPKTSVADAGYGSEENYLYAQDKSMETYIKYNYFHKEQTKKWKNDPFKSSNLYYNSEKDCLYCPMGQEMKKCYETESKTTTGFIQTISIYQAQRCQGCPLRGQCHQGKDNRKIQLNHRLKKLKDIEREKLLSEEGLKHRSKRPCDVEPVFGNIKNNKGFKRFMLRGMENVEIEVGLLAIAHNIAKKVA